MDPRVKEHARLLIEYSTTVKNGDNVLIQMTDCGIDLANEIYKQASMVGANPLICYGGYPWDGMPTELIREYYDSTPEEFLKNFPLHQYELVKSSDVIIHIRSENNLMSLTNIDPKKISLRAVALKRIADEGWKKRWCITQYPTVGYAQLAEMSLREYKDFIYSAILLDWGKQTERMEKLKKLMEKTTEVRIKGPETDIVMSIGGRKIAVENGRKNMPGGEVFTAPIEDSVNGEISFDLPVVRFGREIEGIKLKINGGVIVNSWANKNENFLKALISTDEGSKKLGELGIGMNMQITKFTKNILCDEKMGGTVHLAIGNASKACGGMNESAVHLDMINTMKKGTLMMDGEKILEDGKLLEI